jgi:hypothetical protein
MFVFYGPMMALSAETRSPQTLTVVNEASALTVINIFWFLFA